MGVAAATLAGGPAAAHRHPGPGAPALSEDAAVALAERAIARSRLTRLSPSCLALQPAPDGAGRYAVTVREAHNAACGGDPQTAPRLFTIIVDRKTRAVYLETPEGGRRRLRP